MDSIIPDLNIEEIVLLQDYDNPVTAVVEDITIKRSFKFDDVTKQFIFEDGRNVETTEVEAIEQWIRLILRTYKDKFNVYMNTTFYCDIEDLTGGKLNNFKRSELKDEIVQSILTNIAINKVDNFVLTQILNILTVEFTVTLKDTTLIGISEVMYNV